MLFIGDMPRHGALKREDHMPLYRISSTVNDSLS
jgi:hypothetical protein